MSSNIPILPDDTKPHLALDLVRHLVAQIRDSSGGAQFVDGCRDVKTADPLKICLYPYYWEALPDSAGVIRTVDKETGGTTPLRTAQVTVTIRMPKLAANAPAPEYSKQKRAIQAVEAIKQWTRPGGLMRTEQDSTLPSGRRVLRWAKTVTNPRGNDSSDRFMAEVTFEILYADVSIS